MVFMTQTDHITGLAGATLTITLSKDGGAFAAVTPTVTERGDGWYSLALTSAHTDTAGDLVLHITAAGGDSTDLVLWVDDIGNAIWARAAVSPLPVDVFKINSADVLGTGQAADLWRGA